MCFGWGERGVETPTHNISGPKTSRYRPEARLRHLSPPLCGSVRVGSRNSNATSDSGFAGMPSASHAHNASHFTGPKVALYATDMANARQGISQGVCKGLLLHGAPVIWPQSRSTVVGLPRLTSCNSPRVKKGWPSR